MKQPVGFDFFTKFKFPGGLRANGAGAVCFGVRRASLAKNRYDKTLWLYNGGGLRRLAAPRDFLGHWWLDDDTLLLADPGDAPQKRLAAAGLPHTRLQTLAIAPGAAPRPLAGLHLDVQDALPLPDGGLLLLAGWDPAAEAALDEAEGDARKAVGELKKQSGHDVVTELPFWQNGGGFTARRRTRLYLYRHGAARPLTDAHTEVAAVRLAPDGRTAWLVAQSYTAVAPVGDSLLRLDIASGELDRVEIEEGFRCDAAVPLAGGGALVAGSDMKAHGINQNPAFYRVAGDGAVTRIYGGGAYSGWQSVGSDLAMPAEPRWFEQDGLVWWVSTVGHSSHLLSICPQSGAIRQATAAPGAVQEIAPAGAGGVYALAMRGQGGPELYHLAPNGAETRLTRLNTGVEKRYALAQPQPVAFQNAGGTTIHGWVLSPPGLKAGESCPAILDVHGGPKTAYGPVLFHEMQLWAAQGWAVLFCNPTGGDGRGDAFADIRGRYGGVDYDDLMAFTDAALAQCPWIDEGRLGITGGSYGGFMVNWAIGHTGRFAAAASQRGISNWGTMALISDIGYYFEPDQAGCDIWQDPAAIWARSPLKYAPAAKTPTLFIHADEDRRCPLPEALQMYTALMLAGTPAELVLFHGENHELSRSGKPQNRLARLRAITGWFEKYLK